ncbi:MAG: DUF721 domain-containing protein [Sphaerochaetaceae bacterium]|nr:DUF721 domain-containing protein [Sphaerochaetaceae bacterium]
MKVKDNYNRLAPEDPVKSNSYFDQVLKRHHIDLDSSESQIKLTWSLIAGETFASVSECEKVSNGTLYIKCKNPSYAASLRMSSRELIKKVNSVFPDLKVTKIRVRIC